MTEGHCETEGHCRISVLLTAYCAAATDAAASPAATSGAFLTEQMTSILPQLLPQDELLVGDDSPGEDRTAETIVRSFHDPRVRYLRGPGQGTIKNIEFLLGQACGDILVLSDQDDVWLAGKLAGIRQQATGVRGIPAVLLHDAKLTDEHLNITCESLFSARNVKPGFLHNVIKNGFTGCCMALTKELLPYILPFPKNIPMHDQWIGLQAARHGRVILIHEPLILYRRHAGTQTGKATSLLQKMKWRVGILGALLSRKRVRK